MALKTDKERVFVDLFVIVITYLKKKNELLSNGEKDKVKNVLLDYNKTIKLCDLSGQEFHSWI